LSCKLKTAHLRALEQKVANSHNRSRRQEIVKYRAEINQIETENNTKNQQNEKRIFESRR
jgi:aminoglycoside phosphotransferase family enzyme